MAYDKTWHVLTEVDVPLSEKSQQPGSEQEHDGGLVNYMDKEHL